jgi:PAS domain S-box-containing protein
VTTPRPAGMSVATFTVVILATTTALVLGGIGVTAFRLHRDKELADLREAHGILANQLAESLALPIWNFDRPQIDRVIDGALQDRTVQAVVVRLRDVHATAHVRSRDAAWRSVPGADAATVGDEDSLEESREVVSGGDVLGTVRVLVTTRFLEADRRRELAWIAGTTAALIAVLVLGLYGLLWRIVLRPLKEVDSLAAAVSSGAGGRELFRRAAGEARYRGELEGLRTSLERMLEELERRFTELRASEERLRRSELLFRSVCAASPVGIFVVAPDARSVLVENERWSRMSDAPGRGDRPWTDAVVEAERGEVARRWNDAFASRVPLTLECSLRTAAGEVVLAHVGAVPLPAEPGGELGFLATATDVTGVKQAEADARLRRITSQVEGAVFEVEVAADGVRTIAFANDGLEALFGARWRSAPFRLDELLEQVHPDDRATLSQAIADDRPAQIEVRFEVEPGRQRWLFFQSRPLPSRSGAARTWYHFVTDITARKAAAERLAQVERDAQRALMRSAAELAASNVQLDATNRELEAFSYSVSHDLRAPLRHIDGFAQALEEDHAAELAPGAREHVVAIRAATRRMGALIDGLLDLARITAVEMREGEVDLSALGRELAAALAATDPTRTVRWTIAPGLRARGDEALLRDALGNLLDNAWKYTSQRPEAHIELGAAVEPDGGLALFVRDDGAGFDMQGAGKLFGPFQRLHRASEFAGDGIGLATVRRIVLRHGGRIRAEAAPGRGATFHVSLPSLRLEP